MKLIKQFVVTNCSKERPGSIVTETLKNGILILIVTSKEWHFNADFQYISFIKIDDQGDRIDSVVLECRERAHSNGN